MGTSVPDCLTLKIFVMNKRQTAKVRKAYNGKKKVVVLSKSK